MKPETPLLLLVATFTVGAICIGCGQPNTQTKSMLQTSSQIVQTNMTNLVFECEALARDGALQRKSIWMASDQLPSAIKSLSPQVVQLQIIESPPATVVDIQISGGFQHRGYLVVCASKDPSFVPQKGRGWRITKVAPAIFEYRE